MTISAAHPPPEVASSLQHVGMTVADLESAGRFWVAFLGATLTEAQDVDDSYVARIVGYPGARLRVAYAELPGGPTLELLEYHNAGDLAALPDGTAHRGNTHLALTVADIDTACRRAIEAGARAVSPEPVTIDAGPDAGTRCAYLRTPDGATVELLQPMTPPATTVGSDRWAREFFTTVDSRDIDAITSYFTDDIRLQAGNAAATNGVATAREAFLATIGNTQAVHHEITGIWNGSALDGALVVSAEALVTYTLPGDRQVSVPCTSTLRLAGEKITDYRMFIDTTPVFGPAATDPRPHPDEELKDVGDQQVIRDVLSQVAVLSDDRDWAGLRECLSDMIDVDYTALIPGMPQQLSAEDLIAGWRALLESFTSTHHLLGDMLIEHPVGDTASARAYVQATHFTPGTPGGDAWQVGGTYRYQLRRTHNGWRLTAISFHPRWAIGNSALAPSGTDPDWTTDRH